MDGAGSVFEKARAVSTRHPKQGCRRRKGKGYLFEPAGSWLGRNARSPQTETGRAQARKVHRGRSHPRGGRYDTLPGDNLCRLLWRTPAHRFGHRENPGRQESLRSERGRQQRMADKGRFHASGTVNPRSNPAMEAELFKPTKRISSQTQPRHQHSERPYPKRQVAFLSEGS